MCEISWDKIKDIYLIQYLLTFLIISRHNEPVLNTTFWLLFSVQKETNVFPFTRELYEFG